MLVKVLAIAFSFELRFANYVVQRGLRACHLCIPEQMKTVLVDRVHRLRLDTRLILSLLWLIILLVGLPLEFKIWDLETQVWTLKFLMPIFKFLAYWRGFLEGTTFGIGVSLLNRKLTDWINLQRQKAQIYYLLYRCKAI